jgi:hypothetical protein
MLIYRVSYRNRDGQEHTGFTFHDSLHKAQNQVKQSIGYSVCTVDFRDVALSKIGIFAVLNEWASHPDNG